jgi:hypothetical protein
MNEIWMDTLHTVDAPDETTKRAITYRSKLILGYYIVSLDVFDKMCVKERKSDTVQKSPAALSLKGIG